MIHSLAILKYKLLCNIILDIVFGVFFLLQQFAVPVQIEKYVWHLKNVCVVLDGQEKTAQKVADVSYIWIKLM